MKVKHVTMLEKTKENYMKVCSPWADINKFYQVMEIVDTDLNVEQYPVDSLSVRELKSTWINPMAFILEIEIE